MAIEWAVWESLFLSGNTPHIYYIGDGDNSKVGYALESTGFWSAGEKVLIGLCEMPLLSSGDDWDLVRRMSIILSA